MNHSEDNLCDKKCITCSALTTHLQRHTGVDIQTYPVCGEIFTTLNCLTQHMIVHSKDERLKCSINDKDGLLSSPLQEQSLIHNDEKRWTCPIDC